MQQFYKNNPITSSHSPYCSLRSYKAPGRGRLAFKPHDSDFIQWTSVFLWEENFGRKWEFFFMKNASPRLFWQSKYCSMLELPGYMKMLCNAKIEVLLFRNYVWRVYHLWAPTTNGPIQVLCISVIPVINWYSMFQIVKKSLGILKVCVWGNAVKPNLQCRCTKHQSSKTAVHPLTTRGWL